jgi:hypothetical protein
MTELHLYDGGRDEFPVSQIITSNLIMLIWLAIGTFLSYLLHPWLGWAYLADGIIMMGFVMRKIVCANCAYYGKRCSLGWGKLSAAMFKQGNIEDFAEKTRIAPVYYGSMTLLPIIFAVIAIVMDSTLLVPGLYGIGAMVVIMAIMGTSRKKTCAQCKMRLICPGCAVKGAPA